MDENPCHPRLHCSISVRITGIRTNSLASRASLKIGDELHQINGCPIRDEIDFAFHASDETLVLTVQREARVFEVNIEKDVDEDTGLSFEPTEIKCCNNHCIFCFVEQLPANLRPTLYIKDEDYRMSFLHGAYVTLTSITDEEMVRIVEQRLSPLYISVHTTNPSLRQRMIRGKGADLIMERIAFLAQAKIEMHTQIVLCPGLNDGVNLQQTIDDLCPFYPHVRSLAIVPVGLTRHRQGRYRLRAVNRNHAQEVLGQVEPRQESFRAAFGETFLYCADELYLLAGMEIPPACWYDDFPQIENGVGMVRQFLDIFSERALELPAELAVPLKLTLVTGASAFPILDQEVMPALSRIENFHVRLVLVRNVLLGSTVTVSGLLGGADILRTLEALPDSDLVLLPPNCLNEDGLFLDNMTLDDLGQKLNNHVVIGDYDIVGSLLDLF